MDTIPQSALILDDDPSSLFIAIEYFKIVSPETRVHTFTEAPSALKHIHLFPPSLLFIDILMPNMDGYSFLKEYEPLHKEQTRVFMLTSSIAPNDVDYFSQHPLIEAFLSKPLSIEKLKKILQI